MATLLEAELLVILSDVEGVYDKDPRLYDDAQLIPLIGEARGLRQAIGGASMSAVGTGGIATQTGAAEEAAAAGIPTIIASGMQNGVLEKVFDAKQQVGTLILPERERICAARSTGSDSISSRRRASLSTRAPIRRWLQKGKSLLPAGVERKSKGPSVSATASVVDFQGKEFARGLVNYSALELNRIKGLHTSKIEKVLGYKAYEEIIHRDDLVIL